MEAFGLCQQPVEANALKACSGNRPADFAAAVRRQIGGPRCKRKGGQLDPCIAALGGKVAGLGKRPIDKGFIADGIPHGDSLSLDGGTFSGSS